MVRGASWRAPPPFSSLGSLYSPCSPSPFSSTPHPQLSTILRRPRFVAWLGLDCDEKRCPGDWVNGTIWVVDEDMNQYSTFSGATLTLIQAMLGDFEQDPIAQGGNLTGRTMMTVYLIITTVTLLNLLVAVVNKVYSETEENGNEVCHSIALLTRYTTIAPFLPPTRRKPIPP